MRRHPRFAGSFIVVCAVLLGLRPAVARPPSIDDIVVAMYEFTHAPDDRANQIKFAGTVRRTGLNRAQNPASDWLTASEQAEGAKIISRRRYSSDPATRGKKRYDGIGFDVRARRFIK